LTLPESVTPILTVGGPLVALVLVVLRFGPDAFVRLLAGTVAVLTSDEKRGQRCLDVLRILRGRDQPPPELPSQSPPEGTDQAPDSTASDSRPLFGWLRALR